MGCNHVPLFSNKQRVKLKGTHEKESLRGLDACSGFESTHYHTYTFYHFLPVECFYQWFKPVDRWSGKFSKFTSRLSLSFGRIADYLSNSFILLHYRDTRENFRFSILQCVRLLLRTLRNGRVSYLFLLVYIYYTGSCKRNVPCLKIPASVLPGNLANPCQANQPVSESLSSIL